MTNRFSRRSTIAQKVLQTRGNSLATKLAILFQCETGSRRKMDRTYRTEFSLFGSTGARKYLSDAERKRFRNALINLGSRQRLFCTVLFWSGGRISEILALTPGAIDIDNGSIALVTLKRRRQGLVRQVPLPRSVIRELNGEFHLADAQTHPETAKGRLWSFSRTTAWRLIKRVMAAASVSGLAASPKGLRHSFGVSAFQANMPPHLVQRWLGHASLRTTAIYADVSGSEERRFASRMWRMR
jgi:integrase